MLPPKGFPDIWPGQFGRFTAKSVASAHDSWGLTVTQGGSGADSGGYGALLGRSGLVVRRTTFYALP
ncbi:MULTISPECIES: hypothetical protein [unclassified Streptomyces]|uniref:hypothetical protein n=1 Tax=unclassified Streptomyces TaxID=2593676 RepID=UPI001BE9C3DE|nr:MULTISPECIES: hypothetical protein [unclassified Streptomyces]MBT2407355.1 hypothetical protein [Streptomyces sp. ISL-21]MBT2611034.1 hypothetical protein [Streptomyces sp. ISL-87]